MLTTRGSELEAEDGCHCASEPGVVARFKHWWVGDMVRASDQSLRSSRPVEQLGCDELGTSMFYMPSNPGTLSIATHLFPNSVSLLGVRNA